MLFRAAALLALLAVPVSAAEITRVASSFEDNDPFGMYLDATFDRVMQKGKITREYYQDGSNIDVSELRYQMIDTRLNLDLHLGLYKDLEFHFGLPIIFQQDRTWGFAEGTNASNSTITNNCLNADGSLNSPAAISGSPHACTNPTPMFDIASGRASYRSGLGNLTFGLAYAVFNQKKDDTKPTWVLAFDYAAPTAAVIDPSIETSPTKRGAVGDKVHHYKFSTSISKRLGWADPYFSLWYSLPWLASGYYSNCDNPSADRMAIPGNCGIKNWDRQSTGTLPQHTGGFIFGSEFVLFEQVSKHQKLALDFRGIATYVSEGRTYNEMSDLFGKQLYSSDYLELSGQAGFTGHAAEFVQLKAYAQLGYQTEHLLTYENVGTDNDGNGVVNVTDNPSEISPNFDYRIDRVGRRFRVQETIIFRIMVQASFSF